MIKDYFRFEKNIEEEKKKLIVKNTLSRNDVPIFRPHALFLSCRTHTCAFVCMCIFGPDTYMPSWSICAWVRGGEGRGCRIAGRGLVFTLISHRLSSSCQTLRPPPCGAPSFHRIRASRVLIPPLLLPFWTLFSPSVSHTMTLPNCAHRWSYVKATFVDLHLSQYL